MPIARGRWVLLAVLVSGERTQLVVGETIQLTATGLIGASADTVNLTQEVEYSSSDPTVAEAQNAPGDRSRIVALKPGFAAISARDPSTGLVSPLGGFAVTVVAP
jgi:hypothetical protein